MASSGDGKGKSAGEGSSSPRQQGDSPSRRRVVGSQSTRTQTPTPPSPQVQYGGNIPQTGGTASSAGVGGDTGAGGSQGNVAPRGESVNVGGVLMLRSFGGAVIDSPSRKRTREEAGEGSSAGGGPARQLVAPPAAGALVVAGNEDAGQNQNHPFRCSLCVREFATAKGLFGHMRSHPDRGWRGAYPPPVFSREEFGDLPGQGPQQGQGVENMVVEEVAEARGNPPPVHGVDLNVEPMDEGDGEPSASSKGKAVWDRDLNKPPPEDSE